MKFVTYGGRRDGPMVLSPVTDDGAASMLFHVMIKNRGMFGPSPMFESWIRSYRIPLSSKNIDVVWGGRYWTAYADQDWEITFFYKPYTEDGEMVCDRFDGDHNVLIRDLVEMKLRYL